MFPFTFDQKLSSTDKRQLIKKKSFRFFFLKKLKARDKDITGIAYHDGKGGVMLALTTFEQTRHWDLVLANPLHRDNGEKEFQWYTSICEESCEDYKRLFENLPVKALTIKQNTPEWFFLLHVFSFTFIFVRFSASRVKTDFSRSCHILITCPRDLRCP
jgi:hypothetical protein